MTAAPRATTLTAIPTHAKPALRAPTQVKMEVKASLTASPALLDTMLTKKDQLNVQFPLLVTMLTTTVKPTMLALEALS